MVIITHNEEHNLPRLLASVSWADEILVVDSNSTDQTAQICLSAGVRFLQRRFTGFGDQKHFAVNAASHNWVLAIDADEEVSAELAAEIQYMLKSENLDCPAYRIPRHFIFMGHHMRFGGEYGRTFVRFFDRRQANYNLADVHEEVITAGKIGDLNGRMLHFSYRNLHDYFQKFNNYTSRAAAELYKKNKQVSRLYIFVRFPFSFLALYFGKGLILDGYPGFIWALCSALYPVIKYAKLREMIKAGCAY